MVTAGAMAAGVYHKPLPCLVGPMYVRVWDYEVQSGQVDAFVAAYGPAGPWAQLFARAEGYAGTQLFCDVARTSHFLTVDRWADAASWEAFLDRWADDYNELDRRLHGLAAGGDAVIEGATSGPGEMEPPRLRTNPPSAFTSGLFLEPIKGHEMGRCQRAGRASGRPARVGAFLVTR